MTDNKPMVIFRDAVIADASNIANLVNGAYRGESSKVGWTTEADILGGQRTDADKVADIIAMGDQCILLVETTHDDGAEVDLLGCAHLTFYDDHVYFGMLSVSPVAQGKGIGRQLLAEIEAIAAARGLKRVVMTVIHLRQELIAYYVRRGYVPTGVIHAFPMQDPRFGLPKVEHIELLEFAKSLTNPSA
jgi:ribosomal protein S18 acetylase RimI-like enzyme